MALKTLVATTAVLAGVTLASARAPEPLVPIALVEDVKSATAGVEFMDYVGAGQRITLGAHDTLVLSYLTSCEHETITGGTVIVGFDHSTIDGGQVARSKVPCDGGKVALSSEQASKSAATAFRVQSADIHPTLYSRTPAVQLPKDLARDDRSLVIERTDVRGERHTLAIDDTVAATRFYDLAKGNVALAPGGIYDASIGSHKITFQIDAAAKSGAVPIVSRLLRIP